MFSYSSIKTKDSYNQCVIEEILSRMVEEETIILMMNRNI